MNNLRGRVTRRLIPACASCLLLATPVAGRGESGFAPDDEPQGAPGATFRMPEVSYSPRRGGTVVFYDEDDRVWLGDIDPEFGRLVGLSGRQTLVGAGSRLDHGMDGPRFAASFDSSAVFFTADRDGVAQPWRLDVFGESETPAPLMTDGLARRSPEPRSDSRAESVDYFYVRSDARGDALVVANASAPSAERELPDAVVVPSGASWVPGAREIVYARRMSGGAQLALFDVATGESRVLTGDAGEKSLPAAVVAPDLACGAAYLAVVDGRELCVYPEEGGAPARRAAAVGIPDESPGDAIRAAAPFAAGGRTYAAAEISRAAGGSEIWVLELGGDPSTRLCRRVDGGGAATRTRPQVFVGGHEVLVFYSLVRETGVWELRRCATGIAASPDRRPPAVRGVVVGGGERVVDRGQTVSVTWESFDDTGVASQQVLVHYATGRGEDDETEEDDEGETVPVAVDLSGHRSSYRWEVGRDLRAWRFVSVYVVAFDAEGNYSRGASRRFRLR